MSDVQKIFGIKETKPNTLKTPERQSIEQTEDYAVKKVIHASESYSDYVESNYILASFVDVVDALNCGSILLYNYPDPDFSQIFYSPDGSTFNVLLGYIPSANLVNIFSTIYINSVGVGIGTLDPTSPLQVINIPEFTDNADALAGGLTDGAVYRTGDILKIVHP